MKKALFGVLLAFALPFFVNAQMCWWEEDYLPDEYTTIPNACITGWVIGDDRVAFEGDVSTGGLETTIYCTIERTMCFGEWDSLIYTSPVIITNDEVYSLHIPIEDYGALSGYCHRFSIIAVNDAGNDTAVFNYVCPTEHAPEVSLDVHPDFGLECYWEIDFEMDANFDESRFKYMIYTEYGDTIAFDVFDTNPEYQSGFQFLINAEDYIGVQMFAKIAGKNSLGSDTDYLPFNFWYDDEGECHMSVWREGDFEENNNFLIYPNPATVIVNFELSQDDFVVIENLAGEIVKNVSGKIGVNTISVSDLPSGIYILRSGDLMEKFIVQ